MVKSWQRADPNGLICASIQIVNSFHQPTEILATPSSLIPPLTRNTIHPKPWKERFHVSVIYFLPHHV